MKLAFCLFRYFPFGGIQRDFMKIARRCAARGHELHLLTMRWDGPAADFPLHSETIRISSWRPNHLRYEAFASRIVSARAERSFDLVIGFNKMPNLDVYFCGDPCFVHDSHTQRSALYRLGGRYRHFRKFEDAVFNPEANVDILLLAESEQKRYQQWHGTPNERFHLLPPAVDADRLDLPSREAARESIGGELGIRPGGRWLLMLGSSYRTKGVDRAIRALASLSADSRKAVQMLVVGRGKAGPMQRLARRLGVAQQVHFLQGRSDVPRFLAAADALVHVSVKETAGMAIVEAIAAGLPVIVTGVCGYAHHVARANCGIVLNEPFAQQELNRALSRLLSASDAEWTAWQIAAKQYAATTDLTGGPDRAVELIEQFAARRAGVRGEPVLQKVRDT